MDSSSRATRHAALGDERRLLIVDQLAVGDRTFVELSALVGLPGNLLAHHLDVLDSAGLVVRHVSEGDRRRRYMSLNWDNLPSGASPTLPPDQNVAFVCTHNSARSQFAAALWLRATGFTASSAGSEPADRVHPTAVRVAGEFGVDISEATPSGYDGLQGPDLIISVCDRAKEAGVPPARQTVHWSVPDPVRVGTVGAFRSAFGDIARRMDHIVPTGSL